MEALASVGLEGDDRTRALAGEIVVVDLPRSLDNELAAGAAYLVDAPPAVVLRALESGRPLDLNDEVQLHGRIDSVRMELEGFSDAVPSRDLASELHSLLRLKPGDRFNFSTSEIEALRETSRQSRLGRSQRHPAVAAAMQATWEGILLERFDAYRRRGLPGIEGFDRGEEDRSRPAEELASALLSEPLLVDRMPGLWSALAGPPTQSDPAVQHHHRWLQQSVQRRVQFVLLDQVTVRDEALLAFLERQYFVGHTYNSLQTLTVCVPVGRRTLVVHSNRTFTDAILGLAEQVARRVGQGRLRAEVLEDATRLREVVAAMPAELIASRDAVVAGRATR